MLFASLHFPVLKHSFIFDPYSLRNKTTSKIRFHLNDAINQEAHSFQRRIVLPSFTQYRGKSDGNFTF